MKKLFLLVSLPLLLGCLTVQPSISNKKVYFANDTVDVLPNQIGFHHNIFPGAVNRSALSSDGKYIALFYKHNTITVYDTITMKPLWTKISRGLSNIKISPQDRYISATDIGNGLVIWDLITGNMVGNILVNTPFNNIFHYDYYNDGKELLILDYQTVYRFDLESKSLLKTFNVTKDRSIYNFTVNQVSGEVFFENKKDNSISVYDIATGKHVRNITLPIKSTKIRLSGNGQFIAILGNENEIEILDYKSGEHLYSKKSEGRKITFFDFSYDGSTLGYSQSGIHIWNWKKDREVFSDRQHTYNIKFSKLGNKVYYNTKSNLNYYDFDKSVKLTNNTIKEYSINDLELSEDGTLYASSPYGNVNPVIIIDPKSFDIIKQLDSIDSSNKQLKILPNPEEFIGMGRKSIFRYNLKNDEVSWIRELDKPYTQFDMDSFGKNLVVSDHKNQQLIIFDTDTGQEIRRIPVDSKDSRLSVSISDIGTMAYGPISKDDNTIDVISIDSGKLINKFKVIKNASPIAKLSNDGTVLITAGTRGIVTVWNTKSGKELMSFETGNKFANNIDYNEKTNLAVIAFNTLNVTIIDLNNKTFKNLPGHRDRVRDVLFSKNGKYIFSSADDSSIRLWSAETAELIATYLRIDNENYIIHNNIYLKSTPNAVKHVSYSDGNTIIEGQEVIDKYGDDNFLQPILNEINLND